MSEQTNKRPDLQDDTVEVIQPAVSEGEVTTMVAGVAPVNVESATAVEDPHAPAAIVRPPGKEEWIELHEELPRPTYWPISMSVAITLIAFGFVNTLLITAAGIILLIISLIGWIGDVRDEARLRSH